MEGLWYLMPEEQFQTSIAQKRSTQAPKINRIKKIYLKQIKLRFFFFNIKTWSDGMVLNKSLKPRGALEFWNKIKYIYVAVQTGTQ